MIDHSIEIWKDIQEYEGLYQVSNLGRVKSLARKVKDYDPRWGNWRMRRIKERILKPCFFEKKYPTVSFSKGGKIHTRELHRVVAETFLGPCPEGMECCHRDGNKNNNNLNNLRWDTKENNFADNISNGTRMFGTKHPLFGKSNKNSAKLTKDQVRSIRKEKLLGFPQTKLAKKYKVSDATISNIVHGKVWTDVQDSEVSHFVH